MQQKDRRNRSSVRMANECQRTRNTSSLARCSPPIILLTIATAAAGDLISDSRPALLQLVAQNPAAATCRSKDVAVLVFRDVGKPGFIVGAQGVKEFFSCTANLTVATAR